MTNKEINKLNEKKRREEHKKRIDELRVIVPSTCNIRCSTLNVLEETIKYIKELESKLRYCKCIVGMKDLCFVCSLEIFNNFFKCIGCEKKFHILCHKRFQSVKENLCIFCTYKSYN